MDQASGAGVAASRSSSANHRAASSRAGTVAQDEQVLSAMISRLRLQASQATAPQHGPASAVGTSSLGPAGPGRTSPPAISRLAAGRGLGMTTPARMTSRAHAAAVPGGLREQVPRDTGARAGPAGPSSPFTKQSSQGGHQAGPSEDTSFELLGVPKKGKKSKSKKKKQQQLDKASPGGADVLGSARADQARSSGLAPASEPITGTRVAGPTVAAGSPQLDPRWTAAGRSGLGTIPAAVPQGGLQEQAPRGSGATTQPQVSRPTGLYSSRPQQSSQSSQSGLGASNPTGHRSKKHTYTKYEHQAAAAGGGTHGVFSTGLPAAAPPTTVVASNRAARGGVSAAARGAERGREKKLPARAYPLAQAAVRAALPGGLQHPSTIGPPGGLQQQQLPHGGGAWAQVPRATASNFHRAAAHQVEDHVFRNNNERAAATNINRQQFERATGGKPATAPRPTFALGRAAGGEGSAAGLAGALYRRKASGKVGSAGPTSDISSKQKRRRDEEPAEGIPTPSSAFGQPASSVADPMDVGGRAAGRGSEPRSKKNKATLAESKPSQKLVATRSRFKIVHHHAIPQQQGQIVVAATRGRSSHPGPSAAGDERRATNTSTNTNASTNANTNKKTNTKTSTTAGTSSYGPSNGRAPLPPRPPVRAAANKPPVASDLSVVIDGSEAAFAHHEAKGAWSAMGPLLAIQYFQDRGVECVAFLPRQRVDSIAPQSRFFATYLQARSSGAIASVPVGANSRLFILKHALDKKAFVVTNDRFRDLARSSDSLATLGQTEGDLRAYLSRHQVSFTFVLDEFVPDPETPLTRMLTQAASAKRATGNEASRTTARGTSPGGLPSFPLPRPPPGLSGSRDNPTPSMLQHGMR